MVRVGINGFGRIGRRVFDLAQNNSDVEIVMINDLTDPQVLAHLLKYDSVHGRLQHEVSADTDHIEISGRKAKCTAVADPREIDWSSQEVDIVLECTGLFTARPQASQHLRGSVKKVIISAPAKEEDITIVLGVNHNNYQPSEHHIISNASCTTNCLAPAVQVLHENFNVLNGLMTTVHAYTGDQRLHDAPHKDLRRARAAAVSQVPTSTGAAKAISLVIPELKGKLDGMAIRVPTANVSLIDLVCQVEKSTTVEAINEKFQQASQNQLKGILGYSELPLVSIDYNGSTASSTIDALSTKVMDAKLVKILSWYDNESGFSQRMVELTAFVASQI